MPGTPVGNFWPLLAQVRTLVQAGHPMATVLEEALVPVQGDVSAERRVREACTIVQHWPEWSLAVAHRYNAGWHPLYEPARWAVDHQRPMEEVARWATEFAAAHARWPTTDEFRRWFGRPSGHRMPGEVEGQEALL